MSIKNNLCLLCFILCINSNQAQIKHFDSLSLISLIKYSIKPSFIDFKTNFLEWHDPTIVYDFYSQLANHKDITILHIGDSHLQFDLGAGTSRKRLQEIFGDRGRGLVFPYAAAGTHSTYDYSTQSYGNWNYSKNISKTVSHKLGLTGATINTNDSLAGFSFLFYSSEFKNSAINQVNVFMKNTDSSFNFKYRLNKNDGWTFVDVITSQEKNMVSIPLDTSKTDRFFELRCVKSTDKQKEFECSGISFESKNKHGLLYHSVGINGARISSFLKQELNDIQLKILSPDLIVFDLAANDLAFGSFDSSALNKALVKSIGVIRNALPNALIVIAAIQDNSVQGRPIVNGLYYAEFVRKFALENRVVFYDYYNVAGGKSSINKWLSAGLCKSDKCHLSRTGYILKGELFANAFINSFSSFIARPNEKLLCVRKSLVKDSLVAVNTVFVPIKKDPPPNKNVKPVVKQAPSIQKPKPKIKPSISYSVKKGDNLSKIAVKYKTTVKAIQTKNKLKTDLLRIGQILIIP